MFIKFVVCVFIALFGVKTVKKTVAVHSDRNNHPLEGFTVKSEQVVSVAISVTKEPVKVETPTAAVVIKKTKKKSAWISSVAENLAIVPDTVRAPKPYINDTSDLRERLNKIKSNPKYRRVE